MTSAYNSNQNSKEMKQAVDHDWSTYPHSENKGFDKMRLSFLREGPDSKAGYFLARRVRQGGVRTWC